jgi:hypothetical protein
MQDEKNLKTQIKKYVDNAFLTRMLHKNEERETRKGDAKARLAQTGHGPNSSAWLLTGADIEEDCIAELTREHADLYIDAYGRQGLKIGPEVMVDITEAHGNMTGTRKATLMAEAQLTATRANTIPNSHVYARLGSKASIALRDATDKINLYNLTPKKPEPMTTNDQNHLSGNQTTASELHQIAPTLADLKKLPSEQKDRLLLAKLAKMSRHNDSILNKHNLTMSGDPYGMAPAYPELERKEVIEHLLAAPWTRLVNNGYLADFSGHGFYKVTTEGHEYLQQEPKHAPVTLAPSGIPVTLPARIEGTPRIFLSYSWEGDDHKAWVKAFAERLQTDGIQVIFDRWYLKLGQDKLHFMENAVADSDYVAIVCTEEYANRANQREGGVGWESMIITSEVAEHMLTDKFIPVLRQGTFKTSLPRYLKTRMGVNFMGDPYNEEAYEELLRKFHGEPIAPPPIGAKPDFSKKSSPKPRTFLQATGEALANQYEGTLLGPLNKRPNATLHAQYDKPGTPGPRVHAIIRQWDINGEIKFSLETSRGDEFMGVKDDVISMFSTFNRKLTKEGYKRMSFTPGTDADFQSL